MTSLRIAALSLAAGLALAAASSGAARAQLVPRLVNYPAATAPVCAPAGFGLSEKADGSSVAVYGSPDCGSKSLLFTATGAGIVRVTPTALGIATLQQRCGQYPWQAGTTQVVPAGGCDLVATIRSAQ